MIKAGLLLVLLAGASLSVSPSSDTPNFISEDARYIWPTNASHYISSTFAETRSQHFHAAIDIGTWGHEGYPVFATRDGILYRAGVTARGYGNVVYLKHEDETVSLYAHLRDFAPEIREVVDSLRLKDYRFEFHRNLKEKGIEFQQGDIIGWSGSTGVGPPHLHFELRSPENKPFNPLLTNISVEDNIPPRFSGLAVEPLSAHTLIDGERKILRKRPSYNGEYFNFGDIEITGPAGIAVNAFDRKDGSNNIVAVYELEMWVDDEKYFHSKADSFRYTDSRQVFIDRVYPTLRKTRRGYQRLHVAEGNSLPFYKNTGHNGVINLPRGTYPITIIARDYAGNSARAQATVTVNSGDMQSADRNNKTGHQITSISPSGSDALKDWYWHKNWLAPDHNESAYSASVIGSFKNSVRTGNTGGNHPAFQLDARQSLEFYTEDENQRIHRIIPGSATTIRTADHRLEAQFTEESVFDTLSVIINYDSDETGTYVELLPDQEPIASPVRLSFLLDDQLKSKKKLSFFEKNSDQDNLNKISTIRFDHRIEASISEFGRYYIEQDTIPPEVSDPEIVQRSDGKWFANVTVKDERSGIDYRSARFYINNKRGIAEYDPEKDKLIYHHPEFSPAAGESEFKVVVPDKSGNVTQKTFLVAP